MDKEYLDQGQLKLDNQLCFPLYVGSKELVKRYKPYLDPLGLTYTQYITLMVLWENSPLNIKDLGEHLYLDSGTLTPVVKKLEAMGFVKRERLAVDERVLMVTLTQEGIGLKEKLLHIPYCVSKDINMTVEDLIQLQQLLKKMIESMKKNIKN